MYQGNKRCFVVLFINGWNVHVVKTWSSHIKFLVKTITYFKRKMADGFIDKLVITMLHDTHTHTHTHIPLL